MTRYRPVDAADLTGLSRQRIHQYCKNWKVPRDEQGFIIDEVVLKQIMDAKGRMGRPRKHREKS